MFWGINTKKKTDNHYEMNPSKNWWKSYVNNKALSEFERLKLNLLTINWHHRLSKEIKTNFSTEKMMSIEIKMSNGLSLNVKTYKNPVPYKIWTKTQHCAMRCLRSSIFFFLWLFRGEDFLAWYFTVIFFGLGRDF